MIQKINIFDLVISLSNAVDLVDERVSDHHKRVAFISYQIGKELGLSRNEQYELLIAGALHDIGALTIQERLDILNFESHNPHYHAELSFLFLNEFAPFKNIALLSRYHHHHYKNQGIEIPLGSHILHLADRVEVLIQKNRCVLNQIEDIEEIISAKSGSMFHPEVVDVFLCLSEREGFWLNVINPSLQEIILEEVKKDEQAFLYLDMDGLLGITKLFSHIIDFRSHFTATHSNGVAASSEALAQFLGCSELDSKKMRIAGYLHDLGKLAIPTDILEKPGKLTKQEYNMIKSHSYHTRKVLEKIEGFESIVDWAANHHERLDGNGYPFHLNQNELSLGSRILAVADVFTAITEERPYRHSMKKEKAIEILQKMSSGNTLDSNVVDLLITRFDEISEIRYIAQQNIMKKYEKTLKQTV